MNTYESTSCAKLSAALVKANAEVQHALKDSKNPHFKSDYASLASVLDTIKPVYAAHGLAVVQMPGYENGAATLTSRIIHESGEWLESTAGAPLQKNDPQGVGSALTYLRRYSLAAIAGIHQEDDDGNAASASKAEVAALTREVEALIKKAPKDIPEAGVKAALDAIRHRDAARLRAAIAWLGDNMEGAA